MVVVEGRRSRHEEPMVIDCGHKRLLVRLQQGAICGLERDIGSNSFFHSVKIGAAVPALEPHL